MNILFIGPYRQQDGWGLAAKDYARALATTKHNVAIRPIYMSNSTGEIDEQLQEMESRNLESYDIIIQNVLPHLFESKDVPCLGLFMLETDIKDTHWARYIKMTDAALVPSKHEKKIVEGLPHKAYDISQPLDTKAWDKEYEKMVGIPTDTFNFYYIGEINERKNLNALITAFFLEFGRSEPVSLVVKGSVPGMGPAQITLSIQNNIDALKKRLRIYENPSLYKSVLFVTEHLSDDEMFSLHQSCDCFVMPSHGEATCRPAVDAMGMGNTPIVTDNTGMTDFIDEETGWVVPSRKTPVSALNPPLPWIYTGRETWYEIDVIELQKAMRKAFELDKDNREMKQSIGMRKARKDFSYEAIGKKLEKALDDYTSK